VRLWYSLSMKDKELNYPETIGIIVNAEGHCLSVSYSFGEYRPLIGGAWRSIKSLISWKGEYNIEYAISNPWSWMK